MRKKKWMILITIIFFWMIFSTKIITQLANSGIEIKEVDILKDSTNSSIYYWIDEATSSDDLLNTLSIYGWLVSQPDDELNQKEVAVIFKSDEKTYEIQADIFPENTVSTMLENKDLNISNENIRFGISFSTLMMENGIYQMCLQCKGNERTYGFVETNIFFEKSNSGIKECYVDSEMVTAPSFADKENSLGYGWIDNLKVQNDTLYLTGWGFLDGLDSSYQQAIISIKGPDGKEAYYRAYPYSRIDLIGYKGNLKSQNSGIDAVINIGSTEISENDITVYIINRDKWFSFNPSIEIQYSN